MFDLKEIAERVEKAAVEVRRAAVVPLALPLNSWVELAGSKVYGIALALRAGGDEAFFVPREGGPARWVPAGSLVAEPEGIFTRKEIRRILKGVEE